MDSTLIKESDNVSMEVAVETDDYFDLYNFGREKKGVTKKQFNLEELKDSLQETPSEEQEPEMDDVIDLEIDFSKAKKKGKRRKFDEFLLENENKQEDSVKVLENWVDNVRDYTYNELITRVYDIIREKNPNINSDKKQKFIMISPKVVRIGTKKTSFVNFTDICRILHRQPKHLLDFLLVELGTSGSMDGYNQLIVKGRFQQKHIENVLRRYIKEYVVCQVCRSPETILQKDTRLFFLQCETCGSRYCVANIKTGFQAVTKRNKK